MAFSVEIQVLDQIETLLAASGKPADLQVHQFRSRTWDPENLPATVVYPVNLTIQDHTHDGAQLNRLRVRLEHRVTVESDRPDEDAIPTHKALDELRVWASQQLLPLGAVAAADQVVEVDGRWDETEMERLYGGRLQDFDVDFWTLSADPTEATEP